MDVRDQISSKIIEEQELIIGPLAWDEAQKVDGLRVVASVHTAHIEGDTRSVLHALVARYERLFGEASRQVSRDAARPLVSKLPKNQLPLTLQ